MSNIVLDANRREPTRFMPLLMCSDLADGAPFFRHCCLLRMMGRFTGQSYIVKETPGHVFQAINCTRICLFSKPNSAIKKETIRTNK